MRKLGFLTAILALLVLAFAPLLVGQAKAFDSAFFGPIPDGYVVADWGWIATQGKIGFLSGTRPSTIPAANWHAPMKVPFIRAGKSTVEWLPLSRAAGIAYRAKVPGRLRLWSAGSKGTAIYASVDTAIAGRRDGGSIEYPVRGVIIAPLDSIGIKMSTADSVLYGVLYKVD